MRFVGLLKLVFPPNDLRGPNDLPRSAEAPKEGPCSRDMRPGARGGSPYDLRSRGGRSRVPAGGWANDLRWGSSSKRRLYGGRSPGRPGRGRSNRGPPKLRRSSPSRRDVKRDVKGARSRDGPVRDAPVGRFRSPNCFCGGASPPRCLKVELSRVEIERGETNPRRSSLSPRGLKGVRSRGIPP